eukprot:SAG31_NODE_1790_length_7264_cov_3.356455_2_plen_258_part_00
MVPKFRYSVLNLVGTAVGMPTCTMHDPEPSRRHGPFCFLKKWLSLKERKTHHGTTSFSSTTANQILHAYQADGVCPPTPPVPRPAMAASAKRRAARGTTCPSLARFAIATSILLNCELKTFDVNACVVRRTVWPHSAATSLWLSPLDPLMASRPITAVAMVGLGRSTFALCGGFKEHLVLLVPDMPLLLGPLSVVPRRTCWPVYLRRATASWSLESASNAAMKAGLQHIMDDHHIHIRQYSTSTVVLVVGAFVSRSP